jgi:glutamate synthase domain-containing protein 2
MAQAGNLVVLRRRRRGAGRFALRGAALRARLGEEPRRRLRREADAPRASASFWPTCSPAPAADRREPEEFRRYGSARKLYNFNIDNAPIEGGLRMTTRAPPPRPPRPFPPRSMPRSARRRHRHLRHPRRRREAAGAAFRRPAVPRRSMSAAIRWRATASAAAPTSGSARASRKKPMQLDIPITIAGMSFGALSGRPRRRWGAAPRHGHLTTTGDGGMTDEERGTPRCSSTSPALALRHEPRRSAPRRRHRDRGGPGRQARRRRHAAGPEDHRPRGRDAHLPKGIDQRSACRHPDWTGPDDLEIKILELREITGWEKPIYVKIGGTRPYYDTALAVKAGADVVVLDGMQGGTAATQDVFIEHVGMPTLACIRQAVQALQDLDMHREVQLVVSGGIRTGADVAKALALGADAVSIGTAALVALGDNDPRNGRPSTRRWAPPPGPMTTGTRARPGRHHHPGPGACRAARPGGGRPAAAQLPRRADAGGADHRARLRQEPCAQPRARGPLRADGRGGGHGRRAAGGHRLVSRRTGAAEGTDDARSGSTGDEGKQKGQGPTR